MTLRTGHVMAIGVSINPLKGMRMCFRNVGLSVCSSSKAQATEKVANFLIEGLFGQER